MPGPRFMAWDPEGVLVGEFAGSGSYRVVWDGRDDAGRELASGVYVFRQRAGNRSEARKLLL
jgi:YD repeat-containing protein